MMSAALIVLGGILHLLKKEFLLDMNSGSNQNFDRYQDMMPEGAIPLHGLRMVAFLNSEGVICYRFRHAGDVAITQIVGLLEMVKADILNIALTSGGRDQNATYDEDVS